ncbi:MAG: DUF503 domain-containing protein [Acidobacteria bacterium]|nr:MAG: DUF503 domain-containing protein [Acidobacteriota bacterium]
MRVGILVVEIFLPGCASLKDKRRVVRAVKDRTRHRHNVAAAEVDHQERRQRATIAFASVAGADGQLDQLFDRIVAEVEEIVPGGVRVTERDILG